MKEWQSWLHRVLINRQEMYTIDNKTEVSMKTLWQRWKLLIWKKQNLYSGLKPDEKIVIINHRAEKIDEGRYFSSVFREK